MRNYLAAWTANAQTKKEIDREEETFSIREILILMGSIPPANQNLNNNSSYNNISSKL
jgi:hypothetical protein